MRANSRVLSPDVTKLCIVTSVMPNIKQEAPGTVNVVAGLHSLSALCGASN